MSTSRHDKPVDEWLLQAYHDLGTARYLFDGGRFTYAAFFGHLAIEKALKALYRRQHDENPPVTHDLRYLADRLDVLLPDDLDAALDELDQSSINVLNLYPDRLDESDVSYSEKDTNQLLVQCDELLNWIRDHVRSR